MLESAKTALAGALGALMLGSIGGNAVLWLLWRSAAEESASRAAVVEQLKESVETLRSERRKADALLEGREQELQGVRDDFSRLRGRLGKLGDCSNGKQENLEWLGTAVPDDVQRLFLDGYADAHRKGVSASVPASGLPGAKADSNQQP